MVKCEHVWLSVLYGTFGQLRYIGYCIICLLLICFVSTVVDLFCIRDCRWVWSEAGQQMELEAALGIGGFGYPVCINSLQPYQFIVLSRVWLSSYWAVLFIISAQNPTLMK